MSMTGVAPEPRFLVEHRPGVWIPSADSPWGDVREVFGDLELKIPKPNGTLRLFCMGASTVLGFPFEREVALADWIREGIAHRHPDQPVEIYTFAQNGRNARAVATLAEELVNYEPDALIVYTGHNELHLQNRLELAFPGKRHWTTWGRRFALGRLFLKPFHWIGPSAPTAGHGFESMGELSETRGEPAFPDPLRQEAERLYEQSLSRIVNAAQRARIPLILSRLVSNHRDYPPTGSVVADEHAASVADKEREIRNLLRREQGLPEVTEPNGSGWLETHDSNGWPKPVEEVARSMLEQALEEAPDHAKLWFLAARLDLTTEDVPRAREGFEQALHLDLYPFRAPAAWRQVQDEFREEAGTFLVDATPQFLDRAPGGIPGAESFWDSVHPNWQGQALLAQACLLGLEEAGVLDTGGSDDWKRCWDRAAARLELTARQPILAERLCEVGWIALRGFAHRGCNIRPSSRLAFSTALQWNPDLVSARLGVALIEAVDTQQWHAVRQVLQQHPESIALLTPLGVASPAWRKVLLEELKRP